MPKARKLLKCFVDAGYNAVVRHDGIEHAGYLAYILLLALFPFLVLFAALAGTLGESEAGARLVEVVLRSLPYDVAGALQPRIVEIISGPPQGLMTIAIIGGIWTASSAVEGLRTVLNKAYHVETPPAYIWRRLLSIVQYFLLTGAVMLVMLLLVLVPVILEKVALLKVLSTEITNQLESYGLALGSVLIFLFVATLYYIIPNVRQSWVRVAPGALLTTALWVLGARLFTGYLQDFDQVNIIYGGLEGIIAALLFFYIMSLIFIYGAEFNYVFEKALGYDFVEKVHKGEIGN